MTFNFEDKPNGFVVTLGYTEQKTSTEIPKVSDKVSDKLSLNQQKIIESMKVNSKVTYSELAEIVGVAPTSIARNVKKLIEYDIIRRVGSARGGYWEVDN